MPGHPYQLCLCSLSTHRDVSETQLPFRSYSTNVPLRTVSLSREHHRRTFWGWGPDRRRGEFTGDVHAWDSSPGNKPTKEKDLLKKQSQKKFSGECNLKLPTLDTGDAPIFRDHSDVPQDPERPSETRRRELQGGRGEAGLTARASAGGRARDPTLGTWLPTEGCPQRGPHIRVYGPRF